LWPEFKFSQARKENHTMKSKTIPVNGTDVVCSHEVKVDRNHQTQIHLTVAAGSGDDAVSVSHVLTVGASDGPLPAGYGPAEMQADFDKFRQQHAELCETKLRAKKLAAGVV
jgi:hypothetical protein